MTSPIIALVSEAIQEVNEMRDPNQQIPTAPETLLSGEGGVLDSLGIASLIVAVEQRAEALLHRELNLIEWVLDRNTERLTIGDLIQMITERVK